MQIRYTESAHGGVTVSVTVQGVTLSGEASRAEALECAAAILFAARVGEAGYHHGCLWEGGELVAEVRP